MARRRTIPSWIPTLLVAAALFLAVFFANKQEAITVYWYQVIELAGITAISALGLNLIYGFNGQFSLGHIGFYAIGAYASALITKDFNTKWSGGQVNALSWMIAGQLGILVILFVAKWMRMGVVRDRIDRGLADLLRKQETWMIKTLVMLAMLAVAIAVGVFATIVMQKGLLFLLSKALLGLSEETAKPIIFFIALFNGGTMAAMVAYLVGLPLLRLGSDYLGIATLGFAIMMYTALQNSDMVIKTMKGARGMVAIPRWTTWGWVFGALVVSVIIIRNLVYSSQGRAVISVREDEIAAKTMGIDIAQHKAVAFAFGGFFAGIAGGLYAHLYGFLHPSQFGLVRGFDPLIIIVFGGLGSMTGTILASALFIWLLELMRVVLPQGFEDWRFVIYPIILLLVMLLRQQGLMGTNEWGWLRAPLPPERDIPVPDRTEPKGVSTEGEDA